MAAYLKGDQKEIKRIQSNLTAEKKLSAITPVDIPLNQKQSWLDFFAGCTSGVLKQNIPLKGALHKVINHCDCTARKYLNIKIKDITQDELNQKIMGFANECQKEII